MPRWFEPSVPRRRGQHRPFSASLPNIDWSHPLSQGLLFYGLDGGSTAGYFGGGSAGNAAANVDLVTGNYGYRLGSSQTPGLRGTPYGAAFAYDGGNSVSIGANAAIRAATAAGNFTFACAFIKTGTVGTYARPFGRTANNNGSQPYMNWDFEINPGGAGQGNIVANVNSGGTGSGSTTGINAISDNTYITAVGVLSGSNLSLYINGALVQTWAGITAASYNTQDSIIFGGGSDASVNGPFLGVVFFGAFWSRVLSPDEIMALHLDPYDHLVLSSGAPAMPIPTPTAATKIFLTTGTTWTVPSDWNSGANTIECVGGGGGGNNATGNVGTGGEGGHYAKSQNITLTPGAVINIAIGAGGAHGAAATAGGATWLGGTSLATSFCGAVGGAGATNGSANATTATTNDVGNVVVRAGGYGAGIGPNHSGGSGGGGAAGPGGVGGGGGTEGSATLPGGGGGGAGNTGGPGGLAGNADSGNIIGGVGGAAGDGTAGGAGGPTVGSAGSVGSHGSGGGGGGQSGAGNSPGGAGGSGVDSSWDVSHGPGGGGGAGGNGSTGGNGGLYGGGGAGAGWSGGIGGDGAQGIIVVQYTPGVHRYWRLLFQEAQPGNNWRFIEIALKATPGGGNFATVGANCSSSSNYSGAYLPANAIDGNTTTSWVSASQSSGTEFWGYDNGSAIGLQEITITADTYLPGTPLYADVQRSDNGSTWVTEWSFIAPVQWTTGNQVQTFTRNNTPRTGGHRYWSILWNTNQSGGGTSCGASNIALRTVSGGANICQAPGGTPLSESNYPAGGYRPFWAFDPDPTFATSWVSSSSYPVAWVGFDFGAGEAPLIVEVAITARNDAAFNQGPGNGTVRWSNDGSTWTNAWTFTASTWTIGQTQVFTAPVPNTTWSPTDKSAGITLSGGNLIATASASGPIGVRTIDRQITGKFYWEYTCNTISVTSAIGIANAAASLIANVSSATSLGICAVNGNGTVYVDGINLGNNLLGTITNGTVVCVAYDAAARLIWFRYGAAGNWNANAANNPATGIGGFSAPVAGVGFPAYPALWLGTTGHQVTANFGDTAFTGSVPAGFTSGFPPGTPATNEVVTQIVVDEWATGTPAMQLTQLIVEEWGPGQPAAQLTQAFVEEWGFSVPQVQLTQAFIEEWAQVNTANTAVVLTQAFIEQWVPVPPAVVTYTTWSPTDHSGGTLTGSNLIATGTGSGNWFRTADREATGKFYWEVTMTTWANGNTGIGLTNATSTPNVWNATSFLALFNNGTAYVAGSQVASGFSGTTTGAVIGFALDADAKLAWIRVAPSGNWNGSSTANPATGAGGISVPFAGGPFAFYPAVLLNASGDVATANFGATAFSGAVPASFTSGFPTGAIIPNSEILTQIALEEWSAGAPTAQLTQIGIEEWASGTAAVQLTQIAIEEWGSTTATYATPTTPSMMLSASRAGIGSVVLVADNATRDVVLADIGVVSQIGVVVPVAPGLAGVAATGVAGSLTTTITLATVVTLVGVAATGVAGSLTTIIIPPLLVPVTGVAATGAFGLVFSTDQPPPLLGVYATGAVGVVTPYSGPVVFQAGVYANGVANGIFALAGGVVEKFVFFMQGVF